MALTRKLLEGMGIEDKQIETIIEAHMDTVNGIKSDRDRYKEAAERVPDLEKQIEEAEKAKDGLSNWEQKYKDEHKAFEDYKTSIMHEKSEAEKEKAYRELLAEAGIDPRRIDRIVTWKATDISKVVLEDGKIKDREQLLESVKDEFSDFIMQTKTVGSEPATPPNTTKGIEGADPEIHKMLQARHERLYGKAENKED